MDESAEASPMKAVVEELQGLRAAFRETLESYAQKVDSEIAKVQEVVEAQQIRQKVSASKLRDLRDMLTLLRNAQIKADKGRRKDLKKIDTLVEDLVMLTESWRKPVRKSGEEPR